MLKFGFDDRGEQLKLAKWLSKDKRKKGPEVFTSVTEGMKSLYREKLLPLEERYKFHDFHFPQLDDQYFDSKPMILLLGQYSTGKTTFIRYLLEQEFPGIRIGPEPTTDSFMVVMGGEQESVVQGTTVVHDANNQFRNLSEFGNSFLNRFKCSTLKNPVLDSLTIVDTPGILSGEKQRTERGYDFCGVLKWFAERVDRILLLFDANKLDISDEFSRAIDAIKKYDSKILIILNKAHMLDGQQLMRVHGALMWSLRPVLNTPEVPRVYTGSFWDQQLQFVMHKDMFEREEQALFNDLQSLPRDTARRKLDDLIKRAKVAKVTKQKFIQRVT